MTRKVSEYAIIFSKLNPFLTLHTSQSASTQILKSGILEWFVVSMLMKDS